MLIVQFISTFYLFLSRHDARLQLAIRCAADSQTAAATALGETSLPIISQVQAAQAAQATSSEGQKKARAALKEARSQQIPQQTQTQTQYKPPPRVSPRPKPHGFLNRDFLSPFVFGYR